MTLTIEVRAQPGKVNELYQTLQALLPTMRKENGCQACRVTREVRTGSSFFSPVSGMHREASTAITVRQRSALLGAIDLLGESARVRTGADERWEGIDTLRRIRKAN